MNMSKNNKMNLNGAPEQKTQESLEGLREPEVRDDGNNAGQSELNAAAEINQVAKRPTWRGTGMPPISADRGQPNIVCDGDNEFCFEMRSHEELSRADDELTEKVWYYRNLVYLNEVLAREKTPLAAAIRDRFLREMRIIEQKYGMENLEPLDDFYWGYLMGKLSAIRWTLGLDWD